jgi:hypothetical protein
VEELGVGAAAVLFSDYFLKNKVPVLSMCVKQFRFNLRKIYP